MISANNALPAPLVKLPRITEVQSLCNRAESLQWRSQGRIRSEQLKRLKELCTYAQRHSPYYREMFTGIDFTDLSWQQFGDLPVLARDQLRKSGTGLDNELIPETHGQTGTTMTSGSTGTPVEIRTTHRVAAVWAANALRDHLWHGRDASLTMAALRWLVDNSAMAPEGKSLDNWGEPQSMFYTTGKAAVLNSASAIKDQLVWLLQKDPHYLLTHPSNLQALLAEYCENDAVLSNLKQVRTVGETVSPELRESTHKVLGVPLIDFYSAQEVGYMALQCPMSNHYHVLSDSVVLEVIDEEGRPCSIGQAGKIVVTSLDNYATPLIRYDIGDIGMLGNSCDCGRGLPVLQQVLGRSRNMAILPDGSKKWPNLGFRKMMKVADIRQFQVMQHGLENLELKIVVDEPLRIDQENQLSEILREHLAYPFTVEITYHDEIPRGPNGKYEDFKCLVKE